PPENAAGRGRQTDYWLGGMKRPTFRARAEADELFLRFGPPETYDQQAFGAIECDLVPGKRLAGLGSKSRKRLHIDRKPEGSLPFEWFVQAGAQPSHFERRLFTRKPGGCRRIQNFEEMGRRQALAGRV